MQPVWIVRLTRRKKGRRLQILQDLQSGITLEKHQDLEGEELEVLIDGISKKGGQLTGRTDTNIVVNFKSDNKLLGRLVKVKIQKGFAHSLQGELVN